MQTSMRRGLLRASHSVLVPSFLGCSHQQHLTDQQDDPPTPGSMYVHQLLSDRLNRTTGHCAVRSPLQPRLSELTPRLRLLSLCSTLAPSLPLLSGFGLFSLLISSKRPATDSGTILTLPRSRLPSTFVHGDGQRSFPLGDKQVDLASPPSHSSLVSPSSRSEHLSFRRFLSRPRAKMASRQSQILPHRDTKLLRKSEQTNDLAELVSVSDESVVVRPPLPPS